MKIVEWARRRGDAETHASPADTPFVRISTRGDAREGTSARRRTGDARRVSETKNDGRAWAYLSSSVGIITSVGANVAHSYIPPEHAPTTWSPPTGLVFFAALWPVLLMLALETFARVAWPRGIVWWVLRWVGLPMVALVSAVVSYQHLSGLLTYYGENQATAHIGPLAVDGLMIMSSAALVSMNRREREPRRPVQRATVHLGRGDDRSTAHGSPEDGSAAHAVGSVTAHTPSSPRLTVAAGGSRSGSRGGSPEPRLTGRTDATDDDRTVDVVRLLTTPGLTRTQVATRAGVSVSTVKRIAARVASGELGVEN